MFNPFQPAGLWTADMHHQWGDDRKAGRRAYLRAAARAWLRTRQALALLLGLIAFGALLIWFAVGNPQNLTDSSYITGQLWRYFGVVGFAVVWVVFHVVEKATERWQLNEQHYAQHENPGTLPQTIVGPAPERLFALTNTPDFANTYHCQIFAFAEGSWTLHYATHGGPAGIDLALLPDGRLALSRDDQTVVIIGPEGAITIETPQVSGYVVPLAGGQLLVAGDEAYSKASARITLANSEVEQLDLLVAWPPIGRAGKAYLFDHGRYQIAIVGSGPPEFIPYSQSWRPKSLHIAADGMICAVIPQSEGQGRLWAYRESWVSFADFPTKWIEMVVYDQEAPLALTEQGIYQQRDIASGWVQELPLEQAFSWRLLQLERGAVLFDWFTGHVRVRRQGSWEALPPVPTFTGRPTPLPSWIKKAT